MTARPDAPPPWRRRPEAPPGGARGELAPEVRARRRARARRRGIALVALAAGGLATVATTSNAVVTGGAAPRPQAAAPLPAAARSALSVPDPAAMPRPRAHTAAWAPVRRRVVARAAPGGERVATVAARTPERTTNILEVIGRRRDAAGRMWARVRLAVLPNGTTGWVPRSALGAITTVRTHLVVDLGALGRRPGRACAHDGGDRVLLRAPVGVGRPGAATPTGRFIVRNRLTTLDSPAYGPVAFGTSARSADLTDWPAGGYIGIHGTDRPELLPGRVSHGCIRLRNGDVTRLAQLMPVGTPVTVRR